MKKLLKKLKKILTPNLYPNFEIHHILKDWTKEIKSSNIILTYKITRTKALKIFSSSPGSLIGRKGERIERYKERLLQETKIKKIQVYELKHFTTNFGPEEW